MSVSLILDEKNQKNWDIYVNKISCEEIESETIEFDNNFQTGGSCFGGVIAPVSARLTRIGKTVILQILSNRLINPGAGPDIGLLSVPQRFLPATPQVGPAVFFTFNQESTGFLKLDFNLCVIEHIQGSSEGGLSGLKSQTLTWQI